MIGNGSNIYDRIFIIRHGAGMSVFEGRSGVPDALPIVDGPVAALTFPAPP